MRLRLLGVAPLLLLGAGSALAAPAAGTRGMISSAHPAATDAGVAMLRQGGNAADAAAAVAFALSVVEPYSSGVGGGGFAMVRHAKELTFLDFREVAPEAAKRDMYMKNGEPDPIASRDGILSVAVPGAVKGYLDLQARWGKLKRAQVLAPAIELAANGFPVSERYRKAVGWRLNVLRRDPEASRIFLLDDDVPPLGHLIVQKDKAATLRLIASEGADTFYKGKVADLLVQDIQARGGLITHEDLARYRVRDRKPLVGSFLGHAVASSPPPSAGGQVVLTILNLIETLPLGVAWRDPRVVHLYVEASKRAFADRYLIGDPSFVDDVTPNLVAKDRAQLLAQVLTDEATPAAEIMPGQGAQLPPPPQRHISPVPIEGNHTTHLSVIDADGNAVSMTTTVNYGWGSCVVARGTGVLLNDEMDDFAVAPGVPNAYGVVGAEANAVQPGKVPLSSMSPTLVFQGPTTDSPIRMVVGSPGGPRIPTSVAQVIINHLLFGAPIDQAIALGRIHHQHLPDVVRVEPYAIDAATRRLLEEHGHRVEEQGTWSNATAIAVDPETGVRTGAADPRGIGSAVAE